MRPKGLERHAQRFGLVRIIHKNRRAIVLGHQFEPPARAHQLWQSGKGVRLVHARRHRQGRCDQRIGDLEFARYLEMETDLLTDMAHLDPLAVAFGLD